MNKRTLNKKLRRSLRRKQIHINKQLKKQLCGDMIAAPCCYCKFVFLTDQLTIEHLCPLSFGGSNDIDNIALACAPCNQAKGREAWFIRREIGRLSHGK